MRIERRDLAIESKVSWNDLQFGEAFWWAGELHIKINNGVGETGDNKPVVALATGLMANVDIPALKQFVKIDACIMVYDQPKREAE